MIKHSLFVASLLLLHSLFAIGQADPLTRRFIFESQQDSGFPINKDRRLSGNPSVIADTSRYTGQYLPSYYKRQKHYEVKVTFIESISRQLLYATNLLVAFEVILTSRDAHLSSAPYSWLPVETIVAFGWILKSYWNPDSALLNLIRQQEISQDPPFVITTMMPGSGNNQQQGQPSGSSGLQTPAAPGHPIGYFTSLLYSESGEGNRNPQQQQHTLGLDCFVDPCYGVCKFRSPFESMTNLAEATPEQNSCTYVANTHYYLCIRHSDPINETSNDSPAITLQCLSCELSRAHGIDGNPTNSCNSEGVASNSTGAGTTDIRASAEQATCSAIVVGEDDHLQQSGKAFQSAKALSNQKRRIHTRQKNCEVTAVRENSQQQPCGVVCKNDKSSAPHKSKYPCGLKTCDVTVVGDDGQQRPCGKVCKNSGFLSDHKVRCHTGPQNCDVTVVGQNGQPRPCGTVCQNVKALLTHKCRYHSGQKTCAATVIGKDGQQQPCGKVCKNASNLLSHKIRKHSEQKTCNVAVVGENGQQRPCGTICKNAGILSDHKKRKHTPQRTCDVEIVGKHGQPQPCGMFCKNSHALWAHKSRAHGEQQTCDVIVTGKDAQQRRCGKVFKNNLTLSEHKRKYHLKRKSVDVEQDGDLSHPKGKVSNDL
ncbi:hypothetical protein [Endozoicomonas sp. 8E]|uniref:hypothetical protein n=1 Tax=Endozoicomonas sp. 8E TaxID=3035692 RepID=UPI002938E0F7|nr:hypothetical protein [Endozoicomonas sp. 8E]WOG26971.1 hypothetical protein P6910_20835 [Endozoicomonas sp. 8E]